MWTQSVPLLRRDTENWWKRLVGWGAIYISMVEIVNKRAVSSLKRKINAGGAGMRWPPRAPLPASLVVWLSEPGADREESKVHKSHRRRFFWQGSGLPPTAASSSLLPSSIHLWGAAYSPSPTPHNKTWTSILRGRKGQNTCMHLQKLRRLLLCWKYANMGIEQKTKQKTRSF